jgi:hypothetical protein
MNPDPQTRNQEAVSALLSDVAGSLGRLVKGELALAGIEVAEALRAATKGAAKLVAAVVVGLVGLNVAAGAAVAGLAATGMGAGAAGLVVALFLLGVAAVLVLSARSALRLRGLWPKRALHGLRRDARVVRAGLGEGETHHV